MHPPPIPSPKPYAIETSQRVNAAARDLVRRARAAGRGDEALAALKKLFHILSVYPQYGEPIRDLQTVGQTIYTLSVPPIYAKYAIDEENRTVYIGAPFLVMRHSGFE
jgi:hypothetical protein